MSGDRDGNNSNYNSDLMRYDKMVEKALRGVVRDALSIVARDGLPGNHHFYISFLTQFPGVTLPEHLRAKYPEEMTIVLQFQFSELKVGLEEFSVYLYFDGKPELVGMPYQAVTNFYDKSVEFSLQFRSMEGMKDPDYDEEKMSRFGDNKKPETEEKRGEVISLDMFRKK